MQFYLYIFFYHNTIEDTINVVLIYSYLNHKKSVQLTNLRAGCGHAGGGQIDNGAPGGRVWSCSLHLGRLSCCHTLHRQVDCGKAHWQGTSRRVILIQRPVKHKHTFITTRYASYPERSDEGLQGRPVLNRRNSEILLRN